MAETIGATTEPEKKAEATPPGTATTPPTTTPPAAGAKVEPPVDVEQLKNELTREKTMTRSAQTAETEAKRIARDEKVKRIALEKELKRIQNGGAVVPPLDNSNSNDSEQEIQLKVQLGIKDLIIENPQYRELVDNDPTLKEVIKNNPFVLIQDYYDAPDALEQFKGKLDELIAKKTTQPKAPEAPGAPPVTEPKAIQPSETPVAKPEANQIPSNVDSIAESIGKKVKFV